MDTNDIEQLYGQLLSYWNERNAKGMASLFSENANVVGFDGSQMNGSAEIESQMTEIFKSHKTSTYVWKVREVRLIDNTVGLLRSVVGMVPPGGNDIKPDVNAIQSLVVSLTSYHWKIVLFQNTPARFDGRPELSQQLTDELRQLVQP